MPRSTLQTLRIVRVCSLASGSGNAASRTHKALSSTLTPVGSARAAGARRGGSRSRRRCTSASRGSGWGGGAGANSDVRRAAAEVSLRGDDLVVELRAKLHPSSSPRVEVVPDRDGPTAAVRLADGPVLVERRGADDRGLVHALRLEDVVNGAVGGETALERGASGWVVSAEVLDDVVFDERALCPAVDGQIAVAVGVVGATERDRPRGAGHPPLASNKISVSTPGDTVLSVSLVGVRHGSTAISPERVVVAAVGAGAARRQRLALVETTRGISGEGGNSSDRGRDNEGKQRAEGNHDVAAQK